MKNFSYVVVGGGISGVSCVKELSTLDPNSSILLISSSPIVKSVTNFRQITRTLEEFNVTEKRANELKDSHSNIDVLHLNVTKFNAKAKQIEVSTGEVILYDKLCICTGASPKLIDKNNPHVIGIRDTETVIDFEKRLSKARQVLVVGNGGIATELVFKIKNCRVIWAIKTNNIVSTFLDPGASRFFMTRLFKKEENFKQDIEDLDKKENQKESIKIYKDNNDDENNCDNKKSESKIKTNHILFNDKNENGKKEKDKDGLNEGIIKREKFTLDVCRNNFDNSEIINKTNLGCALGPDWVDILKSQCCKTLSIGLKNKRKIKIEYNVEVDEVMIQTSHEAFLPLPKCVPFDQVTAEEIYPVYVKLTNKKVYGCDFVVSATGVEPNTKPFIDWEEFELGEDGGLKVNDQMQTSLPSVYAAGDVCSVDCQSSSYWIQMRLWSQARQMGVQAARCMHNNKNNINKEEKVPLDFCFELFAHVTKFFGLKVVLLGRFNGQGLGNDYKILVKVIEDEKYIKVILKENRMYGAVLVGETDLEEVFENLILNGLDLSIYGDDLLEMELEDYFD